MTVWMTKGLVLGGLCALLAGAGSAAFAQGEYHHDFHHGHMHRARRAIMRQKADYARAVANGHYGAAERAHLRARAIRHHIRARREMRRDQGM
ncbi:MAG: hypothetical protein JO250_06295 [Armatimonadetes bacterium]|nr:hypothetical protein [Armatimonadota bacterium]